MTRGDIGMTDIFVYCPICNKEDGKETIAKSIKVVIGIVTFELECGHTVVERFKFP